ncbi:MAG: dethiobiotin synthase [Chitinophagaceae bacterium]
MIPVFITGIGTDVGKTLVSAIVTKALGARYWKPIQAGSLDATDSDLVKKLTGSTICAESYRLDQPASPHISAREQGATIDLEVISSDFSNMLDTADEYLVIEGAGGLLVPLNESETVADLIKKLHAVVIIVSRNYLGSINHSLLTASYCRQENIPVAGWIFTDEYMGYEDEISHRSGYPIIGKIPFLPEITENTIAFQADRIRRALLEALNPK